MPETDNQAFQATCSPGSSARFIPTILICNTARLSDGTDVMVDFVVEGRTVHTLPGNVYHPRSEEGIAGLIVRPDINDPIWSILSSNSYVRYQAAGLGLAGMSLSGSSGAISRFLDDCRGILGTTPPAAVVEDLDNDENRPGLADRSCRHLGSIRSRDSRRPVTIRFTNRTNTYRSVLWIDYNGRPVDYANLNPGQSVDQQTYVSHPWMITDGPGNCKEIFVPRTQRNPLRHPRLKLLDWQTRPHRSRAAHTWAAHSGWHAMRSLRR